MAIHPIMASPQGSLTTAHFAVSGTSLVLTFVGVLRATATLIPRLRVARHPRLLLLASCAIIITGNIATNASALITIGLGQPLNLLVYYVARTFTFIPFAPLHTVAVLRRILILITSQATYKRALLISHGICLLGFVLAIVSMWAATIEAMDVGTLDYWLHDWTLPFYGTIAAGMFPLVNVVFCTLSLRSAWVRKSLPPAASTTLASASTGSVPVVVPTVGIASILPSRSTSGAHGQHNSTHASLAGSIVASVSGRADETVAANTSGTRDVGQASVTAAFWSLTSGEIIAWLIFIGINLASGHQIPVLVKNTLYDVLSISIVLLESSFEQVYRRKYNKAKEKAGSAVRSSMMLSTVAAHAGAASPATRSFAVTSTGAGASSKVPAVPELQEPETPMHQQPAGGADGSEECGAREGE